MKLGTQANPLLYVGPQALSYDARQRLRRGVRLLLDLDSIMDAYRNEDSKSEKGSERVEELLESIRCCHGDGKEAVADGLKRDFISSFDEDKVQRYASEITNPDGLPVNSAEIEVAFDRFCAARDEEEKRARVNSSKEVGMAIFPSKDPKKWLEVQQKNLKVVNIVQI